jgi:hypothetical protein
MSMLSNVNAQQLTSVLGHPYHAVAAMLVPDR